MIEILKDFETFDEYPEDRLVVNKKSNYFYIEKEDKNYIAKEKIKSLSLININNKDQMICEKRYYDILDGSLVTKLVNLYSFDNLNKKELDKEDGVKITALSSKLNLGEDTAYLTLSEVKDILNISNQKGYAKK